MLNRHLNTICRCDCENRWIVCSSSCNSAAITKFNYFCQKRRQPAAPQHTLTLQGGRETSQWVLHRRNWLYYTHFKMQCIFLWGEVGESTISTITGILKVSTRFLFTTRHLFPYLHQIFTYRHQISTHLVSVAGGCASECRRPRPQVDWTGGGSVQPAPAWPLLLVPVVTGQQQFLLLVASSAEQRAEYLPATTRHPPHTASLQPQFMSTFERIDSETLKSLYYPK